MYSTATPLCGIFQRFRCPCKQTERLLTNPLRTIFLAQFLAFSVDAEEIPVQTEILLQPNGGAEVGLEFQAWLSPHQESDEEMNAPTTSPPSSHGDHATNDQPQEVPEVFVSATPSRLRADRTFQGHGVLSFTRDFSRAFVALRIDNIERSEIAMLHIHCGKPGTLGPIAIDLGLRYDLQEASSDGLLSVEISNEDLVAVIEGAETEFDALTVGCPIFFDAATSEQVLPWTMFATPSDRVVTLAGLADIAAQRGLYFNLHTTGQMVFGDMRGQLYPIP